MHRLFEGTFGYAGALRIDDPAAAHAADVALDAAPAASRWRERIGPGTPRTILILLPAQAATAGAVTAWARALRTIHEVHIHVDAREGMARFAKLNALVAARGATADWTLIVDDDVALPPDFLDRFVAAAEAAGLVLAQPAHRIHSYASFAVTQRMAASAVRRTAFVETGPVVAFHRTIAGAILPLPETRWGWGTDFIWADRAAAAGWRIGIVDATPIEHLRPAASGYAMDAALAEADVLLEAHAPTITREAMLAAGEIVIAL